MEQLKLIESMTDNELYAAAIEAYNKVKHPSDSLRFLYESWVDGKKTVQRVQSETIYKLSLFEKDALGEEAW